MTTRAELLKAERLKEREQKLAEKKRQQDYDRAIALGEQYRMAVARVAQHEAEAESLKKQVVDLMLPYTVDGKQIRFGSLMMYKQAMPATVSGVKSEAKAIEVVRKNMPQAVKLKIDWELVRESESLCAFLAQEMGITIQKIASHRIK